MLRSHVDHHLRGFMKRLGTANSYLGQLPSGQFSRCFTFWDPGKLLTRAQILRLR